MLRVGLIQIEFGRRREILTAQLQTALDSRICIEQAKGVLAERQQITPAQAFTVLRAHARSKHARLTDLACQVIEGRALSAAEQADLALRGDDPSTRASVESAVLAARVAAGLPPRPSGTSAG